MKSWRSLIAWLPLRHLVPEKDPAERQSLPEVGGRPLRLRLLFWIIIWLMPAAIVSLFQGYERVRDDVADVRDRLIQTARASAADEETVFASAEQVLRTLTNQPEVRAGTPECGTALTNAMKGVVYFSNIARVDRHGEVLCAAVPPSPDRSTMVDRPWWKDATERSDFFLTPLLYNAQNASVVGGVLPLRTTSEDFDGAMVIALDVSWLDLLLRTKPIPTGAIVAMFDQTGSMIASNDARLSAQIFAQRPASPTGSEIFTVDAGGGAWSYALVPLRGEEISVGFAMRNADLFASTYVHVATDLLLPVLMLGLASAAIWIAADRQITRWIVYLRRIATAYAHGHYAIRPVALEEAPAEFRTLGETFSGMAAAVQDRDRRLREALAQKSLLIKETHHRVKNNLQIVMSLLSLQAGKLRDPAAQSALRQAQVRVNALALVHRILHEIEDLGAVDLKVLLQDLAQQIQEGFGAARRDVQLKLDIAERQASSDLAVPLTLFTVEALTNAFKYAFPVGSGGGTVRVSLTPNEYGKMRLAIEDDGMGVEAESSGSGSGSGIGSRLIQGFAHQVGGVVTTTSRPGRGTVVELIFPDPLYDQEHAELTS